MRSVIRIIYAGAIIQLLFLSGAMAQGGGQDHRQYILSKMHIIYGPDSDQLESGTGLVALNMDAIVNSTSNIFNGNPNMEETWNYIVKLIINDTDHGGNALLQQYVSDIIKISGRPIYCYFIDDQLPRREIWPHAKSFNGNEPKGATFLGCRLINRNDDRFAIKVFLHELFHAQDQFVYYDMTLPGTKEGYTTFQTDASELVIEAIPALGAAAMEGLARGIVNYMVHQLHSTETGGKYSQHKELRVEKVGSIESDFSVSNQDIWLYDRLIASRANPIRNSGNYAYFKIGDLPGYFQIHHEAMISSLVYTFLRYVDYKSTFDAIVSYNQGELFRGGCNLQTIMSILCRQGLPDRFRYASLEDLNICRSASDPKKYLLPLAFADFITYFESKNQQEFSALFDHGLADYIECYWLVRDEIIKSQDLVSGLKDFTKYTCNVLGIQYFEY